MIEKEIQFFSVAQSFRLISLAVLIIRRFINFDYTLKWSLKHKQTINKPENNR